LKESELVISLETPQNRTKVTIECEQEVPYMLPIGAKLNIQTETYNIDHGAEIWTDAYSFRSSLTSD